VGSIAVVDVNEMLKTVSCQEEFSCTWRIHIANSLSRECSLFHHPDRPAWKEAMKKTEQEFRELVIYSMGKLSEMDVRHQVKVVNACPINPTL